MYWQNVAKSLATSLAKVTGGKRGWMAILPICLRSNQEFCVPTHVIPTCFATSSFAFATLILSADCSIFRLRSSNADEDKPTRLEISTSTTIPPNIESVLHNRVHTGRQSVREQGRAEAVLKSETPCN